MTLPAALDRFFAGTTAPIAPGDALVIAFSGGPDSLALASALALWAPDRGVSLHAAHLDHGLDPDSRRRAGAAARLAERLGLSFESRRRAV